MEQYVDNNIWDNISNVRMDELVQEISTNSDSLECFRLIEESWPKLTRSTDPCYLSSVQVYLNIVLSS